MFLQKKISVTCSIYSSVAWREEGQRDMGGPGIACPGPSPLYTVDWLFHWTTWCYTKYILFSFHVLLRYCVTNSNNVLSLHGILQEYIDAPTTITGFVKWNTLRQLHWLSRKCVLFQQCIVRPQHNTAAQAQLMYNDCFCMHKC